MRYALAIVMVLGSVAWGQTTRPSPDVEKMDAETLRVVVRQLYRAIGVLERQLDQLEQQNAKLKEQLAAAPATMPAHAQTPAPKPSFVEQRWDEWKPRITKGMTFDQVVTAIRREPKEKRTDDDGRVSAVFTHYASEPVSPNAHSARSVTFTLYADFVADKLMGWEIEEERGSESIRGVPAKVQRFPGGR